MMDVYAEICHLCVKNEYYSAILCRMRPYPLVRIVGFRVWIHFLKSTCALCRKHVCFLNKARVLFEKARVLSGGVC